MDLMPLELALNFISQSSSNVCKKILNLSAFFVTSKMPVLLTVVSVLEK